MRAIELCRQTKGAVFWLKDDVASCLRMMSTHLELIGTQGSGWLGLMLLTRYSRSASTSLAKGSSLSVSTSKFSLAVSVAICYSDCHLSRLLTFHLQSICTWL